MNVCFQGQLCLSMTNVILGHEAKKVENHCYRGGKSDTTVVCLF